MSGCLLHILMLLASPPPATEAFADPRDGASYRAVYRGGLRWMTENLRFAQPGSVCYDQELANCARIGRLYDFEAASRACPPGWRLPSDDDWKRVEMALGASVEEVAKERGRAAGLGDRVRAGGDTGFNAFLAGYYDPHGKAFQHRGRTAAFWTSTLDGADDVSPLARHLGVDVRRSTIWRFEG